MPKLKTHKALLKRVRITGKKKIKFPERGRSHLNSGLSGVKSRQLRGRKKTAKKSDARRLERLLHMRLTPGDAPACCECSCTAEKTAAAKA